MLPTKCQALNIAIRKMFEFSLSEEYCMKTLQYARVA